MASLFDRVVVVDWSARATPARGRDSIWIATIDPDGDGDVPHLVNPPTRAEAVDHLRAVLTAPVRVLLAVDLGLGWPAGTAASLGLPGGATIPPWRRHAEALAAAVVDGPANANNRFAVAALANAAVSDGPGPWWGCPPAAATPTLASGRAPGFPHRTRSGAPLAEWRHAEALMRAQGHRLSSMWQLLGRGSVGSQSLLGVAALHRLGTEPELADRWRPWPFTTGFGPDPTQGRPDTIVVAEAWPSLVPLHPDPDLVRDAAQVWALATRLVALDRTGTLGPAFAPSLGPEIVELACAEEGWILGAGAGLLELRGRADGRDRGPSGPPAKQARAGSTTEIERPVALDLSRR